MANYEIKLINEEQVIQDLKDKAKETTKRVRELLKVMLKLGEEYAIQYVGHVDTGDTLNSITSYRNGNKGFIVAGGAAIWLEFGTGVSKNAGNVHPPIVDSPVPIYEHGTYGKGQGSNPDGWWYISPKDGKPHKTKGIRGNQFMYRTYQELMKEYPNLVKEVMK